MGRRKFHQPRVGERRTLTRLGVTTVARPVVLVAAMFSRTKAVPEDGDGLSAQTNKRTAVAVSTQAATIFKKKQFRICVV